MLEQQLLDRITMADRAVLAEIHDLLDRAQRAWNRIDGGKQCELNDVHHEACSLAHCLRWGEQAVNELIRMTAGDGRSIEA